MRRKRTLARRIAQRLAASAAHALPDNRVEWARAMLNEIEHVPNDMAALKWAIGCLFAGYRERVEVVTIGSIGSMRISRVVLTLEMLLCFGTVAGTFFILPLSIAGGAWPQWPGPMWLLLLQFSTSLIGPAGLVMAFKYIVLERVQWNRALSATLCVLAAWTFVGNIFFALIVASPGYEWQAITLLAVLPLLGAAHLFYIAKAKRQLPAAA
jgi:hypothetical protein